MFFPTDEAASRAETGLESRGQGGCFVPSGFCHPWTVDSVCFLPWKVITQEVPSFCALSIYETNNSTVSIRGSPEADPKTKIQLQKSEGRSGGGAGNETGCEGDGTWSIFKQVSMVGNWSSILPGTSGPVETMCPSVSSHLQVWYFLTSCHSLLWAAPQGAVPPLHFRNQREPQNKETRVWAVRSEVTCTEVGRAERHGWDMAASVQTQGTSFNYRFFLSCWCQLLSTCCIQSPMLGLKF